MADQIIHTPTAADRLSHLTSTLTTCTLPALIVVESLSFIPILANHLNTHHASLIIPCTSETTAEELRPVSSKSPIILITLALQLSDRLSKKQLKRSHFKTIIISELNEIIALGCRDHIQELLKDSTSVLEDSRIIITSSGSPSLPTDVLSFKKYLRDPQILQKPTQSLSLSRVTSFFINYKHSGWKVKKLLELLKTNSDEPTVIVCNSRRTVERLAEDLQQQAGVQANTLHGDLSQADRHDVVTMFLSGITQYLIATELAFNSVSGDIRNSLVINYDLPLTSDKYLQRVGEYVGGRGGGGSGKMVINFIVDDDARLLRDIERLGGVAIEEMVANVAV